MKLHVESTQGSKTGDTLYYYDVQPGNRAAVLAVWEGRPE